MRTLLTPLAVVALLLAGCGGDDDGGAGSAEAEAETPVQLEGDVTVHGTGEATGDTAEIDVAADDNWFEPTFVRASPGATVSVTLTNAGSRPHTFTIDGAGVDEELGGGEEVTVEVTLPDSGATAFYCRFHRGSGMQGAFFFEEGDAVGSGTGGSETTTGGSDDGGYDY